MGNKRESGELAARRAVEFAAVQEERKRVEMEKLFSRVWALEDKAKRSEEREANSWAAWAVLAVAFAFGIVLGHVFW